MGGAVSSLLFKGKRWPKAHGTVSSLVKQLQQQPTKAAAEQTYSFKNSLIKLASLNQRQKKNKPFLKRATLRNQTCNPLQADRQGSNHCTTKVMRKALNERNPRLCPFVRWTQHQVHQPITEGRPRRLF